MRVLIRLGAALVMVSLEIAYRRFATCDVAKRRQTFEDGGRAGGRAVADGGVDVDDGGVDGGGVLGLDGGWLLVDWLEGRGSQRIARWFHAAPATRLERVDDAPSERSCSRYSSSRSSQVWRVSAAMMGVINMTCAMIMASGV